MNLQEARSQCLLLLNGVHKDSLGSFLKWVRCVTDSMELTLKPSAADQLMNALRQDIKDALPVCGLVSTENILFPEVGENSDCNAVSTAHVDGFLYDEEDIDENCDAGQMSRNYCLSCGSRQIRPLTFISHSSSITQLKYMFQHLLPCRSLDNQLVLDIGSRLGAVVYGAALFSGSSQLRVVGVEMNSELCKLQSNMVSKYQLNNYAAIEIKCADITECSDVVQSANVIVMNNIFDFFIPIEVQTRIWKFLRQNITKPGTRLVLTPTIEEALENLHVDIDISSWLIKVNTESILSDANLLLFGSETSEESDLADIHLYTVV